MGGADDRLGQPVGSPVRVPRPDGRGRRDPPPDRPAGIRARARDHRVGADGPLEAGVAALRSLRELGVRLVLDDFGTGYSSLAYLQRLPLDTIKIDRSFVAGLGDDPATESIVGAVVSLAHGLGIDVVAEGIETARQAELLRALGCDRGQGFLFARPSPAREVARRLGR